MSQLVLDFPKQSTPQLASSATQNHTHMPEATNPNSETRIDTPQGRSHVDHARIGVWPCPQHTCNHESVAIAEARRTTRIEERAPCLCHNHNPAIICSVEVLYNHNPIIIGTESRVSMYYIITNLLCIFASKDSIVTLYSIML